MQRTIRAALAALFLALAGTGLALAQTPPMRTFGTVTVDGRPVPAGTVVEVLVGDTVCGTGDVRRVNDQLPLGYIVDVISNSTRQGCAGEGERVRFRVGGRVAEETATFETGSFLRLDLTVTGSVQTPTPGAATPPPFGSTTPTAVATSPATAAATGTAGAGPAATGSATPGTTGTATGAGTPASAGATTTPTTTRTATATVRATSIAGATPTAGNGDDQGGSGATVVVALIGGLAVAGAAAAGYLLYRRSRVG